MILRLIVAGVFSIGVGAFLYLYHWRPKSFRPHQRKQVTSWKFYHLVDWYLKISTVAITLLALSCDHPWLLKLHENPWLLGVGLAVAAGGWGLFVSAMYHLDAQYTPLHEAHLPTQIITTGPYRYIRHPIYTSNVLLLVGLFVACGSCWLLVNLAILIGHYLPTILREEQALLSEFPEYREYAARTGRVLPKLFSKLR